MDVIVTKLFSSAVLKWRKVLRFRIIFYLTGRKIKYKKSCPGIEQVREAERRKIKPFLLENDPEEKKIRAVSVGSRARLNHAQNWSW